MRLAAAVGVAALLLVPAAGARDALIRPGKGIGEVDLGMTLAQVKRAMGHHNTGWSERRSLGLRYLELTWGGGPEDYFAVGLLGRLGALRVATIWTTRRSERTPDGFGPGSSRARVLRVSRGLRCQTVWRRDGSGHIVARARARSAWRAGDGLRRGAEPLPHARHDEDDRVRDRAPAGHGPSSPLRASAVPLIVLAPAAALPLGSSA